MRRPEEFRGEGTRGRRSGAHPSTPARKRPSSLREISAELAAVGQFKHGKPYAAEPIASMLKT
jgi:hypothetical protein